MGASAVISHALARSTFPILLPAIESDLLSNRQQSGLLGSTNFVAYLLGVALVTVISGKVEPIRLLKTGIGAAALGFVTLATATGMATLSAGQAMTGFGSAGIWMSAPAIATSAAPAHRRGMVMGLLSSCMGLGILVVGQGTNLVRAVADDPGQWRPTWYGAAGFAVALLIIVVVTVRVPHTDPVEGGVSIRRLRTVPGWFVLSVGYCLFGLVISAFTGFVGLLLKDQGFSPQHITNLFSALGLAAVLGAVSLGRLSDRVGRRPILTGAMATITVAAALMLVGTEPYAGLAMVLFGAASFTFPVLTAAYVRDHLEDRAFSNALGALTLIYGVGLIVGPTLAGTVADTDLGLRSVFVGLTVFAALSALTISRLPNLTRHAALNESAIEPPGEPRTGHRSADGAPDRQVHRP
ncbi:MAG: MFS transporter [Actinomycetota bacterium]